MTTLESLPADIIIQITSYLDTISFLRFSVISKQCREPCIPRICKDVRIDLHDIDASIAKVYRYASLRDILHLTVVDDPARFTADFFPGAHRHDRLASNWPVSLTRTNELTFAQRVSLITLIQTLSLVDLTWIACTDLPAQISTCRLHLTYFLDIASNQRLAKNLRSLYCFLDEDDYPQHESILRLLNTSLEDLYIAYRPTGFDPDPEQWPWKRPIRQTGIGRLRSLKVRSPRSARHLEDILDRIDTTYLQSLEITQENCNWSQYDLRNLKHLSLRDSISTTKLIKRLSLDALCITGIGDFSPLQPFCTHLRRLSCPDALLSSLTRLTTLEDLRCKIYGDRQSYELLASFPKLRDIQLHVHIPPKLMHERYRKMSTKNMSPADQVALMNLIKACASDENYARSVFHLIASSTSIEHVALGMSELCSEDEYLHAELDHLLQHIRRSYVCKWDYTHGCRVKHFAIITGECTSPRKAIGIYDSILRQIWPAMNEKPFESAWHSFPLD